MGPDEREEKIRLMLVDDEPDFLAATASALTRRGFEVTTVQDPRLVMDVLQHESFDVVILDVKMPGVTGDELFREVSKERPELPVILLTGHGTFKQAFQMSREGVFDYLTKPCDVEKVAEVARAAVARRHPGSSARSTPVEDVIRVLMVDDERDLLQSLSTALGRRGMQVVTASSDAEAFAQLDKHMFDVALVDLKMPRTDGIEMMHRIHHSQPLCEVVLLTGHPSVETAVEGVRQGAFDYLVKPQDTDTIASKIRAAHRRHLERSEEARKKTIQDVLDRHKE